MINQRGEIAIEQKDKNVISSDVFKEYWLCFLTVSFLLTLLLNFKYYQKAKMSMKS